MGLDDQDAALPPHDLLRLAEHDLELPRVLAGLLGHFERPFSRHDVSESHQAPLALGHDLLGDHENVTVDELLAGHSEGGKQEADEVVARAHLGYPVDRDDRKGHAESDLRSFLGRASTIIGLRRKRPRWSYWRKRTASVPSS